MAMLAEPRSKQKWSLDPQNTNWSSDQDRYGYQMMEKMGWSNGKGLGKNKRGSTSHVKIKKRAQNLGLGAKESHDKDWLGQQADFNNLLSALQKHGGNAELRTEVENSKAMLEVAKASRKRVFYKRFIRSKDTSQYSQKDMACIFGNLPSKSAPMTPLEQPDGDVDSTNSAASCPTTTSNSASGLVTYTSKQNIQEYFASRMKELRDKGIESSNQGIGVNGDETVNGRGDLPVMEINKAERRKSKKKSKQTGEIEILADVNVGVEGKIVENGDQILMKESERKSKKSKKSKRNKMLQEVSKFEKMSRNNSENLTNAGKTKFAGEEVMPETISVKTKKSKKCKESDELQHLKNCGKGLTNENDKKYLVEEVLHEATKMKETRTKKRKQIDDPEIMHLGRNGKILCDNNIFSLDKGGQPKIKKTKKRARYNTLDAKNEELSTAVSDNCFVEVQSEDRSAIVLAGKEGRIERKNYKKERRDIEVDIAGDSVAHEENISEKEGTRDTIEEQAVLKTGRNKTKTKKKKAKRDKKDSYC